jgi:hypothetical protein
MRTDSDGEASCLWLIRDRIGWRRMVVFTASAQLLIAWHSASMGMH